MSNVFLIRINCPEEGSAIKIFNTLNSRGLDLTQSDIIKSNLLEKILKNVNELDKGKEREIFATNWREIVDDITKNEYNEFDDFLVSFLYAKTNKNPKRSLSEELKTYFNNLQNPKDSLTELREFVDVFKDWIVNRRDSLNKEIYIKSLIYIPWVSYWVAAIMTAASNRYKEIAAFEKAIFRFYYLYWMSGKTLSKIKQTTFNCIEFIKSNSDIDTITQELERKIKEDDIIESVHRALQGDVYGRAWLKPVLTVLEYNQREKSNWISIYEKDIHIEHILPQTFNKQDGYEFTDIQHEKCLHKIGNVTLLSGGIGGRNPAAKNKPLVEKLKIYQGKNKKGEQINGNNMFQITHNLANEIESNGKKWSVDMFKERQKYMIKSICEILEIEIPDLSKVNDEF